MMRFHRYKHFRLLLRKSRDISLIPFTLLVSIHMRPRANDFYGGGTVYGINFNRLRLFFTTGDNSCNARRTTIILTQFAQGLVRKRIENFIEINYTQNLRTRTQCIILIRSVNMYG